MENSTVVFLRWLRFAFLFFLSIVLAYFCFNWSLGAFLEGEIFFGILRLLLVLFWLLIAGTVQFVNGQGVAADLTGRIPCGIPLVVEYKKEIEVSSYGKRLEKIILVLKDENDKFLFFELPKTRFSTIDFPPLFFLEKNKEENFIVHEIKKLRFS